MTQAGKHVARLRGCMVRLAFLLLSNAFLRKLSGPALLRGTGSLEPSSRGEELMSAVLAAGTQAETGASPVPSLVQAANTLFHLDSAVALAARQVTVSWYSFTYIWMVTFV